MANTYFPWVLRAYRKDHPDIELTLHEMAASEQVQALERGELDIGLVRLPIQSANVASVLAISEPFVVAFPNRHRLALRARVALGSLADEPFIMVPKRYGGQYYDQVMGLCRRAGFNPRVTQEVHQIHTAIGLVSAGLGVTLVPASMQLIRIPHVQFRPLKERAAKTEIAVAWHASNSEPIVHKFVEVARTVISRGISGMRTGKSGAVVRDD